MIKLPSMTHYPILGEHGFHLPSLIEMSPVLFAKESRCLSKRAMGWYFYDSGPFTPWFADAFGNKIQP